MDPEQIRENMRRLSRIGEPGAPGGPSTSKSGGNARRPNEIWTPAGVTQLPDAAVQRKEELQAAASGTVYVIQDIKTRLYKIGRTTNMERRIRELGVGSTARLINSRQVADAAKAERGAHKRYKSARLPQSEYFKLDSPPVI